MAKYLIMECPNWGEALENDEISLITYPYAIVDDYSMYNELGLEIWEILSNKFFKLVKNAFTVEH